MYEGRRGKKHKRRGHQGTCTYCGKSHRKGKRGDSCRGHRVRKTTG